MNNKLTEELDKKRVEIFNSSISISKSLEEKLSAYDYKKYILADKEHFVLTTFFMCMYFFEGKLVKQKYKQEEIDIINNSLIDEINGRLNNANKLKTTALFLKIRQALEDISQDKTIEPIKQAMMFYLLEASNYKFEISKYTDIEYINLLNIVTAPFLELIKDIENINNKDELFLLTNYFFSIILKEYLKIEKESQINGIKEALFKRIDYAQVVGKYMAIYSLTEDVDKKISEELSKHYNNEPLLERLHETNKSFQELLVLNIALNGKLNEKINGNKFSKKEFDDLWEKVTKKRCVVEEKIEKMNQEFNNYGSRLLEQPNKKDEMSKEELDKYEYLLEIVRIGSGINTLDSAITTFSKFYTDKNIVIPIELSNLTNVSIANKYRNFLKILEKGIGASGIDSVIEKLSDFYTRKGKQISKNTINYCENCGTKIEEDWLFCNYCGNKIGDVKC